MAVIDSAVIWRWACWPCGILGWTGDRDQSLHLASAHHIKKHAAPNRAAEGIEVWGVHHFVRSR